MDSCMLKACLVLPWEKSVARHGKAASDHMGEEIAEEIVIDRNGGEVLGHKSSKTKLSIKEPTGNRGSRRGRRANQTCLSKDQDLISEPTSRLTRSMRHSLKEQCQNRSNVPEVVSKKPNFCDRSDGSRGERVMLDTKNAVPGFCICYKEKCQQCLSEEVTESGSLNNLYIHGLAAKGVHYIHRPGPTLQDSGFFVLPELGQEKCYISETVFTCVFVSFFLWTFHPFIVKSKKIYTVLIWCRVLAFLVACQFLRVITFYSTQLPGPNYHCREGSELARLPRPHNVLEVLLLNFPRGVIYGCGDLIFSSHMIFTLVFVRTYQKYGSKRFIKLLGWVIAILQSLLIIASRKHYTVDVVVAWYTVNLVVFFLDKKLPELPDRTMALIPVISKDRSKEENHKLLNGNGVDPADWRPRSQVNGKDSNGGLTDNATKGSLMKPPITPPTAI